MPPIVWGRMHVDSRNVRGEGDVLAAFLEWSIGTSKLRYDDE
jgi:hypothetical protein